MGNFLTRRDVAKILKLPALRVRGMFDRSDFPKQTITHGKRRKTVVDAFDLVMFLNYTDFLRKEGGF